MEAQIENAIDISFNPRSDPSLKAQALEFLNRVRSDPRGWAICLPLATRQPSASDAVRHVSLDFVNNNVVQEGIDVESLLLLRDNVLQYLRASYGQAEGSSFPDPKPIVNKFSQLLTNLFSVLYASYWQNFFDDLLSLAIRPGTNTASSSVGAKLYLKVLASVHDQIADVLVSKSPDELQRDNNLKDLIRARDAQKIASSWRELMDTFKNGDKAVTEYCFVAIGRWASWIDLGLIINGSVLNTLYEGINAGLVSDDDESTSLRDVALRTVMEVLGKKMKGTDKLSLIEALKINELIARLTASSPIGESRYTHLYDTDLAELVAKIVNQTVLDIVQILESSKEDDPVLVLANTELNALLPFVLRYLSDEFDEVCSSIIPCLTDLLSFFRKNVGLYQDSFSILPSILQAIVAKMKYDETADWGTEDMQTDEAEFQELRKRLQNLQQTVAAIDFNLYVDAISNIVGSSFQAFRDSKGQVDWRDVDLALYEIFLFGQLVVKNGGLYSNGKPASPAAERLADMLFSLVNLDIAHFSHPAVQLQYMEICVRYSGFFEHNPQLVSQLLENFVRFAHHDHIKVRYRSWYLFSRIVKQLRVHISSFAQTATQVLDLLRINAELRKSRADDGEMSSDENEPLEDTRFSSQLYLYEAIGNIFSSSGVIVEDQVLFIKSLYLDLDTRLTEAQNGDAIAVLQIHHVILAIGTLAQGYSEFAPRSSSNSRLLPKEVLIELSVSADKIAAALEGLHTYSDVRTAARSAFSRLIGVLGNEMIPQLPRWIDGLLSGSTSKGEMATFLRFLDQVIYGFKADVFDLLDRLLTPVLNRLFASLAKPTSGTDDEIELSELKAQYLTSILVIMNNGLENVLVSQGNQVSFEAVISTLEHFSRDSSDLPAAKLAFIVLTKMVTVWGGPDLTNGLVGQSNGPPTPALPGFDKFMVERFSPLAWALPGNDSFNPKDAQARHVLGEAAAMQQAIYSKTGSLYSTYLEQEELKRMRWDTGAVIEYLNALTKMDGKKFRRYFQDMVLRLR